MERHRWLRKKRRKKKKKERRQRKKKKSQDEASLAPSRANIEEDEGGAVVRVSPVITGVGYHRRNVARGSWPGARGAVRGYTYIIKSKLAQNTKRMAKLRICHENKELGRTVISEGVNIHIYPSANMVW
ncbi:hypothetical protein Bca4012_006388 [Brassica carinata]